MAAWNWSAIVTKTGKSKTFWSSEGAGETVEELAAHVAKHFPGLQFVSGEETQGGPARRGPVPKSAVSYGITETVKQAKKDGTLNVDHFAKSQS